MVKNLEKNGEKQEGRWPQETGRKETAGVMSKCSGQKSGKEWGEAGRKMATGDRKEKKQLEL